MAKGSHKLQNRQDRSDIAHQCRSLRKPITSIYVSMYMVVGHDVFLGWINRTHGFSELLRLMAKEHFGDMEDVSETWERGICQVITDISDRAMSKNEAKYRDISKPALIFEWFADYLEKIYPKKDLSWQSKMFSKEAIEPVLDEIERLRRQDEQGELKSGGDDVPTLLR